MSNRGIAHKNRRTIERIALPDDQPCRPVRPLPPTPHERVRQTLRAARELLPPDAPPLARFFATRDLFRGQE